MRVLVVNAGSSSLKLRLVGPAGGLIGARDLAPGDDVETALASLGEAREDLEIARAVRAALA